jgi:cell wall-associated NlpC family hydrolase
MAATGLRFIGIPYLWGGTTPRGFDCSGLVQRIYRLHGVSLPRDSDQQARRGRLKPAGSYETLRTGDLLFFGKSDAQITHVGMYLADGLFLHAYGHVRVGSLDPRHALYEATLSADWRCTRDPLAD